MDPEADLSILKFVLQGKGAVFSGFEYHSDSMSGRNFPLPFITVLAILIKFILIE